MRIFLRNFRDIDRSRFSSEEAYYSAVNKQKKEIANYKANVKRFFIIVIGLAVIALLSTLIFGAVKLVKNLIGNPLNFDVNSTVLQERNVKLDNKKIYEKEEIKISDSLVVCIDPGHGGEESGEVLKNDKDEIIRSEKTDNMSLALLLQEKLEEYGVTVILTRSGDTKHSNNERCEFANENNADLFVSLHRNNDTEDVSKKGVEIYTPTDQKDSHDISYQTGQYIMDYLNASGISLNGGVHVGSITSSIHDFQVNRETQMASVLLEMGYISNEEDNILYDLNIERYATAIAYGILKSFAPECIAFNATPSGEILNNNLIFDYETLETENSVYSIDVDDSSNYNSYLNEIYSLDEQYSSFSAEFIKQNDKNEIYLTFDVGSDAGNVKEILNILKNKKVKACFFVNYTFAVNHPDLIKAMIENGHIIGNGSKDYPQKGLPSLGTPEDNDEQLLQIIELHEYVLYNYNYCMSLFRFPNGIYNKKLLAIVNNYHYNSIFWSYSYNDYTSLGFTKEDILDSMNNALYSGVIYALRTDSDSDLMILDTFIDNALSKGFVFGEIKYTE